MKQFEKALELVNKFYRHDFLYDDITYQQAIQCSLIEIDEIIRVLKDIVDVYDINLVLSYYEQVKKEIEKL